MLYIALLFGLASLFMTAERILPGRELPVVPHWYVRAALLNSCQLGTLVLAGYSWNAWFQGWSLCRSPTECRPFCKVLCLGLLGHSSSTGGIVSVTLVD